MVELIQIAAKLAGCAVDQILAFGVREIDGALVVVVSPGPKYVFGEEHWRLIEDIMNKGEEVRVVRAQMVDPDPLPGQVLAESTQRGKRKSRR